MNSDRLAPWAAYCVVGVGALIIGTFSVTVLAMIIAVPFGLGAAIYISEFCGSKVKETLKIVIELLSAIPATIPLQLLAYYIAKYRGCNVDQPRNLAKSVTVE